MKVDIPFREEFKDRMLSGKKIATSRTTRYGKAGDTFKIFGSEFVLIAVYKISLYDIAYNYFREEGFNSSEEFIDCWNDIHPRKNFDANQKVWFHKFEKLTLLEKLGKL